MSIKNLRHITQSWSQRNLLGPFVGILFILPFLVLYLVFTFIPILQGFWISLHNWDVVGSNTEFIGLQNYARILEDKLFWSSLLHTFEFLILAGPGLIIAGLALAILLNQDDLPFVGIFRTIFYMPNVLSVTVIGLVFARVFSPGTRGFVNTLIVQAGMEPVSWLLSVDLAMITVALVKVWWSVGFNMLIFLAGLQDIPQSLYDAARVDGGNWWVLFKDVTLPGLRRPMLFVLVLQVIASVQVFPLIDVLTGGGPAGSTRTLVMYLFERSFEYWQLGYGSALAFILFLFLFVISVFQIWFFNRGGEDA
ncbi:MAG: sugar ABC transporter permease [Anaerolineae bacterium]|nr:sugar ABC transporter permease [Anaerolineae bacterium]MCA9893068.1 sugar ABC transporter permease [Anaerolineae bacterium]